MRPILDEAGPHARSSGARLTNADRHEAEHVDPLAQHGGHPGSHDFDQDGCRGPQEHDGERIAADQRSGSHVELAIEEVRTVVGEHHIRGEGPP